MTKNIVISTIRMDESTQSRVAIDEETVKSYALDMQGGAEFPPVIVFHDGDNFWLGDGFHRLKAMVKAGRDVIDADIREGTQRDAILFAVGANATNGLRRTNADKRKSLKMLLDDPEWAGWSDVQIGKACGVSDKTVAKHRKAASSEIPKIAKPPTRTVHRGGTTFQQKTENIGKGKRATVKTPRPSTTKAAEPGDEANYHAYQAMAYLKNLDMTDPDSIKALEWLRDWIDRQLTGAESAADPGLDSQLALSANPSDESAPQGDNRLKRKGVADETDDGGAGESPAADEPAGIAGKVA